jgi:hypothetical protein
MEQKMHEIVLGSKTGYHSDYCQLALIFAVAIVVADYQCPVIPAWHKKGVFSARLKLHLMRTNHLLAFIMDKI